MEKPIQQKQKPGIVTSLNDTTLTKVTYGKYATRVPGEVAHGICEWFSSSHTLLHIINIGHVKILDSSPSYFDFPSETTSNMENVSNGIMGG